MDGFASLPRVGALFAEDFDLPETTPEPEVVDPVFSHGELAAAREAAWRDGYAAGLQKAAESDAAATRQAMTAIAEQFAAERNAAAIRADQSAEAIARLLIDSLAVAFPDLCAQYGNAEVRAVVRVVLPGLRQEQAITVRAHPRTATALAHEIARLDRISPRMFRLSHATRCRRATCELRGAVAAQRATQRNYGDRLPRC